MKDEAQALEAFFSAYEKDLESGAARDLASYQALWQEHAAAIAAAYHEIQGTADDRNAFVDLVHSALGTDQQESTSTHSEAESAHGELEGGQIGPYRLVRLLGSGGMGDVWLAEEDRPRRLVALKLLRRDRANPEILRRFEHEAELLGRLNHPGIARIYAAGSAATAAGPQPFIALQFIEGESLSLRLANRMAATVRGAAAGDSAVSGLTRRDVLSDVLIVEKVARALQAAHGFSVIHRDIKPSNIIITPEGEPVLVDFGIARSVDGTGTILTRDGIAPGTPLYMSPEQIRGDASIDARTDVWSLGVTLFECVTGRRPFAGSTYEEVRHEVLTRDPPSARKISPSIPRDLETVLLVALEKEPDRRLSSAEAFADDLRAILEHHPIRARPVSPLGRLARFVRREPAKAALLMVLAVTLPALASLFTHLLSTRGEVRFAREAARIEAQERLLEAGFFALSQSEAAQALAIFDEALKEDPESVEARVGKGLASCRMQRWKEALDFVEPLGNHRMAQRLRSHALIGLGRVAEAREISEALGKPDSALEHFVQAQIAGVQARSGSADAQARALENAMRAVFLSPRARLLYWILAAESAGRSKDQRLVRWLVDAILVQWPSNGRAALMATQALSLAGAPVQERSDLTRTALRFFEASGGTDPLIPIAKGNLGSNLFDLGDFDGSLALIREVLRENDRVAAAWVTLGAIQLATNDSEAAFESAKRAYELDPLLPGSGNILGSILVDRGETDEAERILEKVVERDPSFAAALCNLGRVRMNRGNLDAAIECLTRAIELQPEFPIAYYNLATAYLQAKNPQRAVAAQRKAVEQNLGRSGFHARLSEVLLEAGMRPQALEAADAEILAHPKLAIGHYTRGRVLMALGRYRDALPSLERGHELGMKTKGWIAPSGSVLAECRKRVALEERLEGLLQGDASDAPAADIAAAAELALRRNQPLTAYRLYRSAFQAEPELATNLRRHRRVDAAMAAARALASDPPTDSSEAPNALNLRLQIFEWLDAELQAWSERADAQRADSKDIRRFIQRCTEDPDLAPFRGSRLQDLPKVESEAWSKFWQALDALSADLL